MTEPTVPPISQQGFSKVRLLLWLRESLTVRVGTRNLLKPRVARAQTISFCW
jgi:hypothetical protein